ncbi:MAG: sigma-70 family RNA polymerase sigma factor [Candidatus Omnitrophica bacterium]|nr:sigma-70 family RNA polymerase sigma factor [Candidatus Omnitrophota bacterium]
MNAFEQLIGRLNPALKGIAYKVHWQGYYFNNEDLYQEALLHLWKEYNAGTISDKTDSYILQGCYFHLKNYIRKTMDKVKLTSINLPIDEDGSTIEDTLACPDKSAEEAVDNTLLAEALKMKGLSEREERVLSLSLSGMTVREIGKEMGISHVMVIKIRSGIRNKWGYQN